ncbi:DUF1016 domain-containing protein [Methanoculleus sp. FWC-SCC1]|uniref:DUF1016 domain-containing protein n=1 Tax=Methanoculleus frigidifontis TaxID=2584085 RepID=A0ABT8MDX8_9EURY|nr:DUF1016 domain-containing protein [Methanoculleus sp. FWC-SCC1]
MRTANTELVGLYRDVARPIVDRQAGDARGRSILQQPVGDLQREFPGIGGFSASDLRRMQSPFEAYAGPRKTRTPGARNWPESQSRYPETAGSPEREEVRGT